MDNSKKLSVWVVEDNEGMRVTYAELINGAGDMFCDRHFPDCESAIRTIKQTSPPDVMLMDIELPGMNGIEAVRHIKTIAPEAIIIMQTVYEDNDKIFQSICAGASGYILKRTPAEKILESIREASRGGAPINAQIARKVLTMFTKVVSPQGDYRLTAREKEILQQLVAGLTVKLIADKLSLSAMTVGTHVKNIYAKMQVNSRSEVVAKALKENLI